MSDHFGQALRIHYFRVEMEKHLDFKERGRLARTCKQFKAVFSLLIDGEDNKENENRLKKLGKDEGCLVALTKHCRFDILEKIKFEEWQIDPSFQDNMLLQKAVQVNHPEFVYSILSLNRSQFPD